MVITYASSFEWLQFWILLVTKISIRYRYYLRTEHWKHFFWWQDHSQISLIANFINLINWIHYLWKDYNLTFHHSKNIHEQILHIVWKLESLCSIFLLLYFHHTLCNIHYSINCYLFWCFDVCHFVELVQCFSRKESGRGSNINMVIDIFNTLCNWNC